MLNTITRKEMPRGELGNILKTNMVNKIDNSQKIFYTFIMLYEHILIF